MTRLIFSLLSSLIFMAAASTCLGEASLPASSAFEGDYFNPYAVSISNSRVYIVDSENTAIAEKMLVGAVFSAVTATDLKNLFKYTEFNSSEMLQRQASDAEAYAKTCEAIFKAFPNKVREQRIAKAHRDYALYTRQIAVPLKPYLIQVKVYSIGTGSFRVTLYGQDLRIEHGSLGHSGAANTAYIVVFVEREISSAGSSASQAR